MRTVLVIDDDPDLCAVLKTLLRSAGYQALCVSDGWEGMAAIAARRPDLVLCDLELPRMDGLSVARAMRREPALLEIPLILMSGHIDSLSLASSASSAILAKPFTEQTMLALVSTLTQRSRVRRARHRRLPA